MNKFNLLGVVGDPILHSRSPDLYHSLLKGSKSNRYLRISAGSTSEILPAAESLNLKGFNVTAPFKKNLLNRLEDLQPAAKEIDAVNLVIRQRNRWKGYNTDYLGVQRVFHRHNVSLSGKNILILGAGGAARAAAYACRKEDAASITFINRNEKNARSSAHRIKCFYTDFSAWTRLARQSDILISCIPGPQIRKHLKGNVFPRTILEADYKNPGLDYLQRERDFLYLSGLEWLVYQGLSSFSLLSGSRLSDGRSKELQKLTGSIPLSEKIALTGFMGTGKTATGKIIAGILGCPFLDSDQVIEKETGISVSRIFQDSGEPSFRNLEKTLIPDMLRHSGKAVFSLGGGAPLHAGVKKILNQKCLVIWLWTPWKTTQKRLSGISRPQLAAQHKGISLKSIFHKRMIFYAETADLVIPMEFLTPESAARRIVNEIHSSF